MRSEAEKQARREYQKRYRALYPDRIKAQKQSATAEQRAAEKETRRAYRQKTKARDAEYNKSRNRTYRKRKGISFDRERIESWAAQNPEKYAAYMLQKSKTPGARYQDRRAARKRYIARFHDRPALDARISKNAKAAVLAIATGVDRRILGEMVMAQIYDGDLPIRVTVAQVAAIAEALGQQQET
ncbi:MAG: hypothetical protein K2Z25_21245 [Beijerinckiaceae bacterium]|nr:hypothetical protein [Beijerinckiaceae bacterium]